MDRFMRALEGGQWMRDESLEVTLLCLLLSFVLGHLIAWVYAWTHAGLSYSRTFTQSLVLITMVVSLVLQIIGNSIVTAFGLMGALAIIRFRNVLKDTRDTAFIFYSLVLGMAVGTQKYEVAVVGTGALLAVTIYLHFTSFGSQGHYDGHPTAWLEDDGSGDFSSAMKRFCARNKCLSTRRGSAGLTELVYQVKLRDRERHGDFVGELQGLASVSEVSLVLRDELAEV